MFKLFNQKNKNAKPETIFPTAKDMLKKTFENWPTLKSEAILKKILSESSKGEREAWFFRAKISKQTRKELRRQGYHINISSCGRAPCFRVWW